MRNKNASSIGDSTTPTTFDAVAAQMAPATSPRAIEVSAIEDCTVDGSTHKNSSPMRSGGVSAAGNNAIIAKPSSGNRTNVVDVMPMWRRQFFMPAAMASRESRAPCRKNSDIMASTASASKAWATPPRQGRRLAATTTPTSAGANHSPGSSG